jgi:hypothetical protein
VFDDPFSRSRSTPGAILQPQPPPWDSEVSLGTAAGDGVMIARWAARMRMILAEGSRSRTYQEASDAPFWV